MTYIPGRGNVQKRPDGQRAGELVAFTKGAADRISDAVRIVERGDTKGSGLTFGNPGVPSVSEKVFRFATFTGAWSINTSKTLTFFNQTVTPNTVSVQNILFPLPQLSVSTNTPTRCAIAKDGMAWYLVNVVHTDNNMLTDVSLTSESLQFGRRSVVNISATAATTGIALSSCENRASGAQLSTFLG